MKRLHRPDLFSFSVFDERLDIDFNGFAWIREGGNVLIDPVPMSAHDRRHLQALGGAAWVVVTNSDHARASAAIAADLGAKIAGPLAEKASFPLPCERWLGNGAELVPGLVAIALDGSKTPGELALLLDETTLVTGDLIRSHAGGSLSLLGAQKLACPAKAAASVRGLLMHAGIDAVLVGDGFCVFRDGHARLREILPSP